MCNKNLFLLVSFVILFNILAKADSTSNPIDLQTDDSTSISLNEEKETVIYYFKLSEDIMPAAWRLVKNATNEANELNADIILMELNTYGGAVYVADSIRTRLMNTKATTISWINNNAASAGALISIACDSIYMAKGSNIGAATVVDGSSGEQMPDKYQSYMRSTMRSTAEAQGRDPQIAEAMVDDRVSIEGIIDSGKVLTFTTSEAIENNFCDAEANSIEEVIKHLKLDNYKVVEYKESGVDKVISFLLNPIVSSILMLMIFGGIYFELQTPGVGFPIVAAVIGAILYFAPLYLEGLAENWEILLFVVGIALLFVEIFVIPGFGVAGVLGLFFVISALTLSLINNVDFDFSNTPTIDISTAFFRVMATLVIGIIMMAILGRYFFSESSSMFRRIALVDEQKSNDGYVISGKELSFLIDQVGIAHTDLRPSGKVSIDDELYDAVTEGRFIDKGSSVKVISASGYSLMVRET